jgi:hypothetical protein
MDFKRTEEALYLIFYTAIFFQRYQIFEIYGNICTVVEFKREASLTAASRYTCFG